MSYTKTKQSYEDASEVEAEIKSELEDTTCIRDLDNPKRSIGKVQKIKGIVDPDEENISYRKNLSYLKNQFGYSLDNYTIIKLEVLTDTLEFKDVYITKEKLDDVVKNNNKNNIADLLNEEIKIKDWSNEESEKYEYWYYDIKEYIHSEYILRILSVIIPSLIALYLSINLLVTTIIVSILIIVFIILPQSYIFESNLNKWEQIEEKSDY